MNLNLVAALNGSGYGVVGLNVLKAVSGLGYDVALFPRTVDGPELPLGIADAALVLRCVRRQRTMDMAAPCLRISGEDDMTLFAGRGIRGGLAFFDTAGLTEIEVRHLRSLDRLFVASAWGRDVAVDHGLDPATVSVAPLGVDRAVFSDAPAPASPTTRFLHVGAWQYRKGQDALLTAFAQAFGPDDDVELRLLCDSPWPGADERWRAACLESPMARRITMLPRVRRHEELAAVMHDVDCGVFPARGEAWNLEVLEMMSCGRPVIVTDYAGHTEYVDSDNALLIEIDELEPAADPMWNTVFTERKTGEWSHLGARQLEQLVAHLRAVHARKQAGDVLGNDAGIATAEQHPWARTARAIVEGLS